MMSKNSFTGSEIRHGILFDLSENKFPSLTHGFQQNDEAHSCRVINETSTTFGYVYWGSTNIKYKGMNFTLAKGMYFTVPGAFEIFGGEGILIEYFNYKGFFNIGGELEESGRLKYIDGCTDSLLFYPIKKGDPCLNALYFPKDIFQTQHTHPSYRIGIVVNGSGTCITPQENINLKKGLVFLINEDGIHSFKTSATEILTVVSFHPDSDFGPEDENHPMINRTIVDGVSANKMPQIFTA